jgi:hypothetical protein
MGTIIVTALVIYIAGVFASRDQNRRLVKESHEYISEPKLWAWSWVSFITILWDRYSKYYYQAKDWFTGKNWKRKGTK